MNLPFKINQPKTRDASQGAPGMVTVIFIALLAIMMVLVMVESSAVIRLHREVKLLEKQQIERLHPAQTNLVTIAIKP
jgi:hypothetical protein